jgi:diguanylate cyclase (GGDEF)-like protein
MLEKETKRCLRYGKTFSLLFIDVDHFKEVNDQKGHQAGDFALQELAKILEDGLRDGTDWVARYGGEEFVISTLETEEASAFKLGERLRKTVESKEFRFEGQNLRLTVSIGVASLPVHNAKVEVESVIADLVKRADACLYQAKDEGRNRTIAYSF